MTSKKPVDMTREGLCKEIDLLRGALKLIIDKLEQDFYESTDRAVACGEVIDIAYDVLTDEATKLARLAKIQKLLAPSAPAHQVSKQDPTQPPAAKTLTNAMGSSNRMSARDRAIAAMQGKLNK